jgi:TonB-dependent Receptor Plug Domain
LEAITISAATQNLSDAIVGIHAINTEQIFRLPATFFDPARLAFSLAGVANTNDQANGMSIRGNSPEALQWRLEGVEIVNPNHLSNAGTFSDRPTQTGGGTNMLSAQMLGQMNFLTGAFPAEYGNALSGVMDMRFRVGNKNKFEHTFQVGLIGIDLSSEGPINRKKGSSYLINYRYSFTGLLGLMGMSFGGEKIDFQDLALHLNFPTRKIGTFSVYAMGGQSANIFEPNPDASLWESEKDLHHVNFNSRMAVAGIKHQLKLSKKWQLRTILANSGLENLRSVFVLQPKIFSDYHYQSKNILSVSTVATGKLTASALIKVGINFSHYFNSFNFNKKDNSFYSFDQTSIQPFVRVSNTQTTRLHYNLGVQLAHYTYGQSTFFEPRVAIAYKTNLKNAIKVGYGLHSYQPMQQVAYSLSLAPIRAHHLSVGHQYLFTNGDEIRSEVFYQSIFNTPIFENPNLSILNGFDDLDNATLNKNQTLNSSQGRNFGLELSYKKLLSKGWFVLANATLYQSKFRGSGGVFQDTRFAGSHITNLTMGKEWKSKSGKIVGANIRLASLGGFKDYEIDLEASKKQKNTVYNYAKELTINNPSYFRPDLRIYHKKSKAKFTRTIALDIQNASNTKNLAFKYYDSYLNALVNKNQLGLIPMLNYRIEF